MGSLVGLVLFLIWQPDQPSAQTLTPEMLSECKQSGIPESVCSAEQLLAKRRIISINFSLEPENPEQNNIILKKGENRTIPFNVVAPPDASLNLRLSVIGADTVDEQLPEGLSAKFDKTEISLPAEPEKEDDKGESSTHNNSCS